LDIVSGCETGSHGVGIDKVVAKAFLAQLGAKPRPWLTGQRVPMPPVMNADDVEGTLNELIAEQLGVDKAKVTPSASFTEDLGADSIGLVSLMIAIQDKFDIEITIEEAEKITTPKDAAEAIKEKLFQKKERSRRKPKDQGDHANQGNVRD